MNIILNNEDINFDSKLIYVDTETMGLHGDVRLLQVYCPEVNKDSVYVFDSREYPLPLIKKRVREARHVVGHNWKYDIDCLGVVPTSWDDTIMLDQIINFRAEKHSLDELAKRVYHTDMYADMFAGQMDVTIEIKGTKHVVDFGTAEYDKKKMQKSNWSGVISRAQYAYAALDVWILPTILESFDIEEAGWTYKLDKATVECFSEMAEKLPIDVEWLETRMKKNNVDIAEIGLPINVNSYQQVRPYIGSEESNDDGLARLCSEGNERACQVRTVRSLRKQNSFITKFLNERDDEDYIHGYLNVGTRSGRSKCADMNLQQIPTSLKAMLKAKPETVFVYADFAQLELRSLCVLIGEDVLENLFRTGQDIHNYTRDALFDSSTQVSDAGRGNSLRQIAKIYNFASLYGAGWQTIGNVLTKYTGMMLTEAELKANKVKWLKGFPGIKEWHAQNIRHWQAKRTLSTPMGRKYIGKLPTDTNNIMNQGLGAEVAKLAMVYMRKEMDMSNMLMFIHDSYTYEAPYVDGDLTEAKRIGAIMADCMQRAWFDITKNTKITDLSMPVDVFVGQNMKTIEDEGCLHKEKYL